MKKRLAGEEYGDSGGCRAGADTASMLTSICSSAMSLPSTVINQALFEGY